MHDYRASVVIIYAQYMKKVVCVVLTHDVVQGLFRRKFVNIIIKKNLCLAY